MGAAVLKKVRIVTHATISTRATVRKLLAVDASTTFSVWLTISVTLALEARPIARRGGTTEGVGAPRLIVPTCLELEEPQDRPDAAIAVCTSTSGRTRPSKGPLMPMRVLGTAIAMACETRSRKLSRPALIATPTRTYGTTQGATPPLLPSGRTIKVPIMGMLVDTGGAISSTTKAA